MRGRVNFFLQEETEQMELCPYSKSGEWDKCDG